MTVGLTDNCCQSPNLGVVAENNVSGEDYTLRMTTSTGKADAVTIKSSLGRVGIFNTSPSATLDVGGDVNITGNLKVNGTQTIIDVDTLRVRDKQIQLARGDDSTLLTDAQADESNPVEGLNETKNGFGEMQIMLGQQM